MTAGQLPFNPREGPDNEGGHPSRAPIGPGPSRASLADVPPEQFLIDLYDRTYARTPVRAATRLRQALDEQDRALTAGDTRRATALEQQAFALDAVLAKHERCRKCGKALRNPDSVARGVGPECWARA